MNHLAKRLCFIASMPSTTRLTLLGLVFVAGLFVPSMTRTFAQTFTASLSGTVSDPTGAAVPNVSLQLVNVDTHATRDTTTGPDGTYTFAQLAPGTYDLTAKSTGFKVFLRKGMTLLASHAATLDISMQLGQVSQSVEVTGVAPLLDTQSGNQSSTLTGAALTELPTAMHNPFSLIFTQAAAVTGTYAAATLDQNTSSFSLNGGRSMSSAILLDGAPDTAADWNGVLVAPQTDTVQEMQVISNTYEAQYGRTGGGVVNLVTKGGSDTFHGQGFEFFQNQRMNATSWGNNAFVDVGCNTALCNKQKKPDFKLNQLGGDIGGPIWKSKHLYFFGGYAALRQTTPGSSGPRTVPTALQAAGDFSATYNPDGTLQVLYNPFTTTANPGVPGQFIRQPFDATCVGVVYPHTCAGNKIPSNLLDPVGVKVMSLFPSSTSNGDPITNANNYYKVGSGKATNDWVNARIDWAHNAKHTLAARFTGRVREKATVGCYYCNGADVETGSNDPGWQATLNNTFTPTPNLVINVILGAGHWLEDMITPAQGKLTPSSVGLNPADFQAQLVPSFAVGGYAGLGPQFNQRIQEYFRYTYNLQTNLSWEHGHHSVKFGWIGEPDLINNVDRFSGAFTFAQGLTGGPIASTTSVTTGNSLASLLLGTASYGENTFNPDIAAKLPYYGWYGQDTWRVTRKLTVSLGLRYEIQTGATERYNRFTVFDPTVTNPLAAVTGLPLKGGVEYATASNRDAWQTDYRNLAPRIGIAYQVTPKLVARAGFGIFFMPTQSLFTFDYPGEFWGYGASTTMNSTVGGGGLIPQDLLRNPFPNGSTPLTGSSQGLLSAVGQSPFEIWPSGHHPTPYKQNWSMDFQYEFRPGTVLDVGYLGYGARKLVCGNPNFDVNQLPTQDLSMGSALDALMPNPFYGIITSGPLSGQTIAQQRLLRPFPEFGAVQLTRSFLGFTNNYDAFTVRLTHRFTGGLTLLSSYQWSKNLDNASEDQGWVMYASQWRDYYNRKLDYSLSAHDIPQSFVNSLVYELPVGHGKKYGNTMNPVLDKVVGGWQFSTNLKLQSGFPFYIEGPSNLGNYGFPGASEPDLVSTKAIYPAGFTRTPNQWFNTCTSLLQNGGSKVGCSGNLPVAWVTPLNYTFGNAPRYISNLRSDWQRYQDIALTKYFRLTEQVRLQFRAEFYNTWNTPLFGNGNSDASGSTPSNYASSSTFGEVYGTYNSPRTVQLALKITF